MKTVTFDESMYVLVPREPTPEMVAVAVLALHETASLGLRNADAARNAWIAMVEETCRTHKAVPSGDDEVRVQNFYSRAMRELVEDGERATQTTIRARAEQLHKAFLANPAPPTIAQVPEVDAMVNRFLGWPLPKTFTPDCGISFTPLAHPNGWPVGTNLLTAAEAREMFEYVLNGSTAEGRYKLAWDHIAANSYDHHTPHMVCIPSDEWKAAEAMIDSLARRGGSDG